MREKIKTIIWDLDNTLYKFNDGLIQGWNLTAAQFVSDNSDLTYDAAVKLAEDGWINHRDSKFHFVNNHGFNARDIADAVDQNIGTDHVTPCMQTPELMQDMTEYRHIILTLAVSAWAKRVLHHVKLDQYFDPELIFGAEHDGFEDKAHSPRGILTVMDKIDADPADVMFVEDTLANLKPAKDVGLHTTYLHHNRPVNDNEMGHVDLCVQDTPELLKWFKRID